MLACGVLHNVAHCHGIPLPEHIPLLEEPDAGPVNLDPSREAIRAVSDFNDVKRQGHNLLFKYIYYVANISKDIDNLN